jgi:GIY-YIG catalytic domain
MFNFGNAAKTTSRGFVYAISDPKNPRVPKYIGKTINALRKRLGQHIASSQEENNKFHPFYSWLNSVLDTGFLPVVYLLEDCPIEELQIRETHWIRFFKPLGILNRSEGKGTLGMKLGRPSEKNIQMTIARNKRPKTQIEIERARERQRHKFKSVRCKETGEVFESLAAAERKMGTARFVLRTSIVRHGGRYKGKTYEFV